MELSQRSNSSFIRRVKQQKSLLLMSLLPVIWLLVFCYYPLYGITVAFKDYNFGLGIFGSPWAGTKHFQELFNDPFFGRVLVNTLRISFLKLVCGFPVPILFAILLNELRGLNRYRKIIQTMTYLPYFISWAFIASYLGTLLMDDGLINSLMLALGVYDTPKAFMAQPTSFLTVIVLSDIWKSFGFSSIIYLAAITSIDIQQYEAATIDGASRFRQVLHVTLPNIKPTIIILLILSISGLIGSNFEQMFLLNNGFVDEVGEVLSTYTYKIGIRQSRFSYATAVDLFSSVVSVTLLLSANFLSKKLTGDSFF